MENHLLAMLAVLLVGGMLFYYFVCWTVRRGLRDRARAYYEPEFREAEVARLSAAIDAAGAAGRNDASVAPLWQRRAELHYYAGRMAAAAADARAYLALAPDDPEGWAELAEYALASGAAAEALSAARAALAKRERDDYHALALRACLWLGDLAGAADELARWEALDQARVANPPTPHRWSLFAQMPKAEIVTDPAVAFYRAALLARRGDDAGADAALAALSADAPGYLEAANDARLVWAAAPAEIPGAAPVPLLPAAAREQGFAATAAARAWAAVVAVPPGAAVADASPALKETRAWLAGRHFPHVVFVVCEPEAREALRAATLEGERSW